VQHALAEENRTEVLVIDTHVLRRASLMGLLEPWAIANRVVLVPLSPEALRANDQTTVRAALGVLSLGGTLIAESFSSGWLPDTMQALSQVPTAILSDHEQVEEVVSALRAGARGFIPTTMEPTIALQALTFIMGGGSFFPPGALLRRDEMRNHRNIQLARRERSGDPRLDALPLTTRQRAVLLHLQDGQSNKAIARILNMRESTVKVHVGQIIRKLGVTNRTQVALTVITDTGSGAKDTASPAIPLAAPEPAASPHLDGLKQMPIPIAFIGRR
jgi:DNA-binding NarL/FixJ family response regulator